MERNWIYEVIVSVKEKGVLHYSPMGVFTPDGEKIVMEIFKTSETCGKILEGKNFRVNFTGRTEFFYKALMKDLNDCFFVDFPSIDVKVEETEDLGDRYRLISKIEGINKKEGIEENLVNRAKFLILECLIYYTKPNNNIDKLNEIIKFYEKIKRVAPGSDYERMAFDLMEKLKNYNLKK